jgi:DNA-binding transcriptional regulator YhcF (GntR family)
VIISVDASSATPPFDQVRVQLISLINTGALTPGTRLPTVRALAAELHLAPNTVARAYKELEEAGFVQTRGRAGTFVAAGADASRAQAMEAARAYAETMQKLGLSTADAIDFATAALTAAGTVSLATPAQLQPTRDASASDEHQDPATVN